ncbi:MAG TPA: hypothetical protein HPP76_03640 [Desulfuromonadales bacterium]|nr:hypothetical protein [Desulfuromonadales bacterium]
MKFVKRVILPVLFSLSLILMGTGFACAAVVDDAAVFVEAFNAYQSKDYLLALEKAELLNQVFPDSPLKDVTLLLIARSSMKSGDNLRAAKTMVTFFQEFSQSGLLTTIENDLRSLESRLQKGEILQPDSQLLVAAQKTRSERFELERIRAQKLEQERLAQEKAELERVARLKLEAEQRERERLAAENAERDSTRMAVTVRGNGSSIVAGTSGTVAFDIVNRSGRSEEFLVEAEAAAEYAAAITPAAGKSLADSTRIQLKAGETFSSAITLRMPNDKVDGHRLPFTIRVKSAKYPDIVEMGEGVVLSSAPLVRAVAKLEKARVTAGEQLNYRITLLNLGTMPAQDMTVRLQLPSQIDVLAAEGFKYNQEPNGTLVFRVDRIDTGRVSEISMQVKVRENSTVGTELRGQVEVINGQLQRKDIFSGSASVVQSK